MHQRRPAHRPVEGPWPRPWPTPLLARQVYAPTIAAGVTANITATQGLLATSRVAVDLQNPTTAVTTVVGRAYFSFLSSQDAALRLGGNPFENRPVLSKVLGTPPPSPLRQTFIGGAAVDAIVAACAAEEAVPDPFVFSQRRFPVILESDRTSDARNKGRPDSSSGRPFPSAPVDDVA